MKCLVKSIFTLLLVTFSVCAYGQSDSALQSKIIKRPSKKAAANLNSLELVYKTVTAYSSNGRTTTYSIPFVRINGKKPVEIGRNASVLSNYYYKCPLAMEEINAFNQNRRKAKLSFYGSFGVGAVMAFSGLFAAAKEGAKPGVFWTRFGIGGGIMIAGTVGSWVLNRRADEHLRKSVDLYNANCYVPPVKDTTTPAAVKEEELASVPVPGKKLNASAPKFYQDTFYYEKVRNQPEAINWWGITADLASIDVYKPYSSLGTGIGAFYTFNNNIGINVNWQYDYLHLSDYSASWLAPEPVTDKTAQSIEVLGKFPVGAGKVKTYSYRMHISNTKYGEMVGDVKADMLRTVTLRAGAIHAVRPVVQLMNLKVDKPEGSYGEFDYSNINDGKAITKSEIITAGVGFSKFRDLKINLRDETMKGKREVTNQTDLYVDVMYAPVFKYEDVIYYRPTGTSSKDSEVVPVTAPINRIGARIGAQAISMGKWFGIKSAIELGLRPGPKVENNGNIYLKLSAGLVFGGRHH
ncbi:hypothetical protein SAMN05444266_106342 [Chitinophaga jiangningensis]|uniref:Outer membrane protein beta-barrel domain-containing protein n=1 Tax=Chitinophaga jiangningensis TaxID=1419482 RepID=A0A1M7FZZ7_9BACT|nr:hypothetical protein [Chitinophaga jiangningensis]SHM09485.1 hypothetical protein SAMN05444266_106342 [Chitinophaga jiangningensis]